MIIECKCAVFDKHVKKVAGKAKDEWVDFAFDTDLLQGIRQGFNNDKEECNIYICFEVFIIDMHYKDVLALWKKAREPIIYPLN